MYVVKAYVTRHAMRKNIHDIKGIDNKDSQNLLGDRQDFIPPARDYLTIMSYRHSISDPKGEYDLKDSQKVLGNNKTSF